MRPDLHVIADQVVAKHAADTDDSTAGYDLGNADADRTQIDCTPGLRDRVVDRCMEIFAAHPAVYARGGQLVRVIRADLRTDHNRLRTDADRLLIAPCAPEWIATELVRRAAFVKWNARTKGLVSCDPPSWVGRAGDAGRWHVRECPAAARDHIRTRAARRWLRACDAWL